MYRYNVEYTTKIKERKKAEVHAKEHTRGRSVTFKICSNFVFV